MVWQAVFVENYILPAVMPGKSKNQVPTKCDTIEKEVDYLR